jgi:hypothetical protein
MSRSRFLAVFAGYLALAALAGCRQGRDRSDAQAFLAVYETLDHRAPAPLREKKLALLEELTLVDPVVKQARDDCVSAHRALLTAERQHDSAAGQLDKAISKHLEGSPLPAEEGEPIRVALEQANSALTDARDRFASCESAARGLSLRFGKR